MNRLSPLHYLPVFLKRVSGRIMLYNPAFISTWNDNADFLRRLKLHPKPKPYLNNFFFDELRATPAEESTSVNWQESLLSLCLESLSLPSKITHPEYNEIMQGNYLAVTEKFLSRHVFGHVASSRHVLLKDIQIKGVGRTASTQQLSYPNLNGFVRTPDAIRGYYNGQLLYCTLPFGAVRLQATMAVLQEKLHSSLVIRDAHSHRLAQIEPIFLSDEDKAMLLAETQKAYGNLSIKQILDRLVEQHVCLWVMGIEHPMTVDNLALAGFPMDEEDMRPGSDLSRLCFDFHLHLSDSVAEITHTDQLWSHQFSFYSALKDRFERLIKYYQEVLCYLRNESAEEYFPDFRPILERLYEAEDVDRVIRFYQQLSSTRLDEKALLSLSKADGVESVSVSDQMMQARQTIVRIHLKLRLKSDLRGEFHQCRRIETEKVIQSLGKLETDDASFDSSSSWQTSSQLHRVVNRQSFCLGERQELSVSELSEKLKSVAGNLSIETIVLFRQAGELEVALDELQRLSTGEAILLEVKVQHEGRSFSLPTPKWYFSIR